MNSDFTLFAWKKGEQCGGILDRCGDFTTVQAAIDFFKYSDHCKNMNTYHIIDWNIDIKGS